MISKQLDKHVTSLSPKDQEATLSTLRRIFDSIIQQPKDDKYRQIKLTDDSCVQIVSQLLKSFLSSSATGVVPFPCR